MAKRHRLRQPDDTICPNCGRPQKGTAKGCRADEDMCVSCREENAARLKKLIPRLAPSPDGPYILRGHVDADG